MTIIAFDNPEVDHPALAAFAELAAEYCDLVETHEQTTPESFRLRMRDLIPRLYAAGLALPSTDVLYADEPEADPGDDAPYEPRPPDLDRLELDPWRALYGRLSTFFGEVNHYREVFDPWEPPGDPEVTGSLADDIADIYLDLRCGLLKWNREETGPALWEWRFGLEHHWGEHATGAIRALHCRAAWHDDPWPSA
jgi:hypothetical protein